MTAIDSTAPVPADGADIRGSRENWFIVAGLLLLGFSAFVRLAGIGVSLFEDEVWVADLVTRGRWVPHSQWTPPAFYWLMRGWVAFRGVTAETLREPAALLGVATAAVPFLLTTWDRTTRLVWSFLLAFSSPLIFYSTRLKQYTLDAFIAALLVVLLIRALEGGRRWWLLFFATSLAGVSVLYSPVFVIGAAAFATAAIAPRRWTVLACFGAVFCVAGAAYVLFFAPGPESVRHHGDMEEYFTQTGRWLDSPGVFRSATLHWTGQSFNLVPAWWLFCLLIGVHWLRRETQPRSRILLLALTLLPPAAVAAGSIMHKYPYGEVRLMVFVLPPLYLLVARAASLFVEQYGAPAFGLAAAFCVVFAVNGALRDTYNDSYMALGDATTAFEAVSRLHRPGEPIFAERGIASPLLWHRPELAPFVRPIPESRQPGWFLTTDHPPFGATVALRVGRMTVSRIEASVAVAR